MRAKTMTLSAVGSTAPFPTDNASKYFSIGLGVSLSAGASLTYKVQHTFDDIYAPGYNPATGNWLDHEFLVGKTVSDDGNYAFAVRAVRLTITAYTSGTASFTILQS